MTGARGVVGHVMRAVHGPIYRARIAALVREIAPNLREGDRVLDVGCGFGTLGRALLEHDDAPRGLSVRGLERRAREHAAIEIDVYDGGELPYDDRVFDVVILADVLHHEARPHELVDECARVADRLLVIKDHALEGPLARMRVGLIDWAANAPYDVPCRYEYNTVETWRSWHARHDLAIVAERTTMALYPAGVNLLFGRRLQYFAVLRPRAGRGGRGA